MRAYRLFSARAPEGALRRAWWVVPVVLVACAGEAGRLRWQVDFACEADAIATEQLTFRAFKGGCEGTDVAYEDILVRGGTAAAKYLEPGTYGLHVQASGEGGVVAEACAERALPSEDTVQVALRSAACAPADGGVVPLDAEPQCMPPMDCRPCAQDGDPGDCPPTSCTEQSFGDHNYLFCSDRQQWAAARTECRKLSRDLVVIESEAENAFIAAQISGTTHWIGANDRGNNGIAGCTSSGDEGSWYWVNPVSGSDQGANFCNASGSSSQCNAVNGRYTSWSPGEPNNEGCSCIPFYKCEEGEDCAVVTSGGAWQDTTCRASLPYVCESY